MRKVCFVVPYFVILEWAMMTTRMNGAKIVTQVFPAYGISV